MSKGLFNRGENCICPHCGADFEEAIEDFAIPGRIGEASKASTDCFECDKWFTVEQISENEFRMTLGKFKQCW